MGLRGELAVFQRAVLGCVRPSIQGEVAISFPPHTPQKPTLRATIFPMGKPFIYLRPMNGRWSTLYEGANDWSSPFIHRSSMPPRFRSGGRKPWVIWAGGCLIELIAVRMCVHVYRDASE